MLTLYQAEWCPFSSAVRELLTEIGLDFVARQVEPWPDERTELRRRTGADAIPVLQTEDGTLFHGTRAIFRYLETLPAWEHALEHRERFHDHRPARESDAAGLLIERAELRFAEAERDGDERALEVRDNRAEHRYELRLGDEVVGIAAYHLHEPRIVFTHTDIDPSHQGRGLGSKLVAAALADARERQLEVVPLCPFVARYVATHPEVQDLVAAYGPPRT